MDIFSVATTFFLSFVLGAVIGLEREVNEKDILPEKGKPTALIGLRSFSLITALGALVGFLYIKFIGLAILIAAAYFALLVVYYILDTQRTKNPGLTTEVAMIYAFLIGVLLASKIIPVQLTLALTIVVTLLLSQKKKIKNVVEDIKKSEINAFISFAIIAIVILPFLPNTSYAVADIPGIKSFLENVGIKATTIIHIDIINPFKLWLIVALVTGVDFIGYILGKTLGQKKGWLLASAVGGFVSSTATTQSLAQESRDTTRVNPLVSAAILSNIVSFFQIAVLIGALNALLLAKLIPMLLFMIIAGMAALIYFLRIKEKTSKHVKEKNESKPSSIIDIGVALKFAILFLAISIISKIALELFGNSGFLAATGIGSLIGLDAVMINTAQLAGKQIDFQLAGWAFILANAVNLTAKALYSFTMGKKEFAVKFLISMVGIILASTAGLFFI